MRSRGCLGTSTVLSCPLFGLHLATAVYQAVDELHAWLCGRSVGTPPFFFFKRMLKNYISFHFGRVCLPDFPRPVPRFGHMVMVLGCTPVSVLFPAYTFICHRPVSFPDPTVSVVPGQRVGMLSVLSLHFLEGFLHVYASAVTGEASAYFCSDAPAGAPRFPRASIPPPLTCI